MKTIKVVAAIICDDMKELTIKCKDMYGHDVIIKVAMTVNKR